MEPNVLSEKPKFNWKRLLIVVSIVIIAAGATGSLTWYFMNQQIVNNKSINEKNSTNLQKQISDLNSGTKISLSEYKQIKFKYQLLLIWGIDSVIVDPNNENKFYFLSKEGSSTDNAIFMYDISTIPNFENDYTDESKTFPAHMSVNGFQIVYKKELTKNEELQFIGFDGTKLVFFVHLIGTSPGTSNGSCQTSTKWLYYKNLFSIDIAESNPTAQSYTISTAIYNREKAIVDSNPCPL
jgi:hypothetical protein